MFGCRNNQNNQNNPTNNLNNSKITQTIYADLDEKAIGDGNVAIVNEWHGQDSYSAASLVAEVDEAERKGELKCVLKVK